MKMYIIYVRVCICVYVLYLYIKYIFAMKLYEFFQTLYLVLFSQRITLDPFWTFSGFRVQQVLPIYCISVSDSRGKPSIRAGFDICCSEAAPCQSDCLLVVCLSSRNSDQSSGHEDRLELARQVDGQQRFGVLTERTHRIGKRAVWKQILWSLIIFSSSADWRTISYSEWTLWVA